MVPAASIIDRARAAVLVPLKSPTPVGRPTELEERALPSCQRWRSRFQLCRNQPPNADNTDEPTPSERSSMSSLARAFMQQYDVPGPSVAVGRAGTLVYEDAFGFADREKREAVSPMHLFRIASVSNRSPRSQFFRSLRRGVSD